MVKKSTQPGFRFRPTDAELVAYYLKRKVMGKKFDFEVIPEVELYKYAPWDLPENSRIETRDLVWYFFCPRNRKYLTGPRASRTTNIGYWKTSGRERTVVHNSCNIGKKRTLIFYEGKMPHGNRTDWVMYEYLLEDYRLAASQIKQDSFTLCKIFRKSGPGPKMTEQYGAPFVEEDWEDDDNTETNSHLPLPENLELSSNVSVGLDLPDSSVLSLTLQSVPSIESVHQQSDALDPSPLSALHHLQSVHVNDALDLANIRGMSFEHCCGVPDHSQNHGSSTCKANEMDQIYNDVQNLINGEGGESTTAVAEHSVMLESSENGGQYMMLGDIFFHQDNSFLESVTTNSSSNHHPAEPLRAPGPANSNHDADPAPSSANCSIIAPTTPFHPLASQISELEKFLLDTAPDDWVDWESCLF